MSQTTTFPLLALTLMLWLIWTDSVRPQRASRIVYSIRSLLFLAISALLMFRMLENPGAYSTGAKVLMVVTGLVGVLGAGYFGRKVVVRQAGPPF
jgi:hypothetical protein